MVDEENSSASLIQGYWKVAAFGVSLVAAAGIGFLVSEYRNRNEIAALSAALRSQAEQQGAKIAELEGITETLMKEAEALHAKNLALQGSGDQREFFDELVGPLELEPGFKF